MSRQVKTFWSWYLIAAVTLTGCHPLQPFYLNEDGDLSHLLDVATDIEYPDVEQASLAEVTNAKRPLSLANREFEEIWELSLEEAVSIALQNSKVLRSIGQVRQIGTFVANPPSRISASPDTTATIYDPAILETGQQGVEQALAAFDAQLQTNAFIWNRTDEVQSVPFGRFDNVTNQRDQFTFQPELSKRSAAGTQLFARSETTYDDIDDALGLGADSTSWLQAFELEMRQPLLRGAGTQINRIPIVLARIRTDIQLHDFEINVRNFVSEVERAYWDLYFFYRNLEATKVGRDSALATWQVIHAKMIAGTGGGEAENEAQSREQYFFFRARVEEALRDLYKMENRLRYLMGLAATDGRLIRPRDEPTMAEVAFDWQDVHGEAIVRNPEVRRHKWRIKQREMELIAARNQLLPQLDLIAAYRFSGRGDDWIGEDLPGNGNIPGKGSRVGQIPDVFDNSSAFGELQYYQGGRLGVQFGMPVGFRREMAQVRSQELTLAREKARLEDLELEMSHLITDAIQSLESQYALTQTNFNRIRSAVEEVDAIQAAYDLGTATIDRLLDAQRRRSQAEIDYYRSLVEYNVAIIEVHYRKGSLLEYDGIVLAEGPWPEKAYFDSLRRARRRDASYYLNYGFSRPKVISRGPVQQQSGGELISEQLGDPGMYFTEEPEDVLLEPIPASEPPEPGALPSAAPPAAEDSLLEPTATKPSMRPALTAPSLGAASSGQPTVRTVGHTEDQFDWGAIGFDDSTNPDGHTEAKTDGGSPPRDRTVSQLKWRTSTDSD